MNRRKNRGPSVRGMTAAIVPITVLAVVSACDLDRSSITNPGPFQIANARGGPGAPGGGNGNALVDLTAGVTTAGQQQVVIVTDNRRRLTLDTPSEGGYESAFDLTNTYAATLANCTQGSFEGTLTASDLFEVMIEASRDRDFTLYIDKDDAADGAVSDYQQLRQTWHTATHRFVTFIGFKNKQARLPGVSDPVVNATDLGGGTTLYTFRAGHGIVAIDELHESVGILCPLLDDVEVRVTITP